MKLTVPEDSLIVKYLIDEGFDLKNLESGFGNCLAMIFDFYIARFHIQVGDRIAPIFDPKSMQVIDEIIVEFLRIAIVSFKVERGMINADRKNMH